MRTFKTLKWPTQGKVMTAMTNPNGRPSIAQNQHRELRKKTGDSKGTAKGELAVFDDKTEEEGKLGVNDTTLGATKGKTYNDKST